MYIYLQCMYKVFYSTFHNFLPLSIIECTRTMDNGREFLNGLYEYKAHAQRQNKTRCGIINKTTVLFVEPPSSVRWILFVGSLDPFLRFVERFLRSLKLWSCRLTLLVSMKSLDTFTGQDCGLAETLKLNNP